MIGVPVALAGLAACGVAWLQLDGLPVIARLWAVVLLVPLPLLMVVQARMLETIGELPRVPAYLSSIASLWLLALITFVVAWAAGISAGEIGLGMPPGYIDGLLTALLLTAAGVAVLFAFRFAGFRETSTLRELLPVSAHERLLFVAVSVSAGICEEFIFRGFLLTALSQATGSAVLAVVISSGAFGVLHAYQRPAGAVRAALLGALFAVSVTATSSLWPAIVAHTLIDVLSGLWLARYLLR